MSYINRVKVTITTAADGSATAYTEFVNGLLHQIRYVKNNFDNGSTFTITDETTGASLWSESNVNASADRAPRQSTHAPNGTAALYAAGGTAVQTPIAVSGRIKIVIASGGNAKTGDFYFDIA